MMKSCQTALCLFSTLLALSWGTAASAQDTNALTGLAATPAAPPDGGATTTEADLAKPGENHKILADMCGQWTSDIKFWMTPDTNTAPMEFKGTTITKSLMGGRYFVSDDKSVMNMPGPDGKMQPMDFAGQEMAAYDNVKKQFVSTWIDNTGTGIYYFTGTYDPVAKAITYRAEVEPFPGTKMKVREVITILNHDHHTMEYYQAQGGREMKAMEIKYTRTSP